MAGKQAKILSADHIDDLIFFAERSRHPDRNRVIVLLSIKAGLRAGEIANLTWSMVLNASGRIGTVIELRDDAAKKGSGRSIPIHGDLQAALDRLGGRSSVDNPVVRSERGGPDQSEQHRQLVRGGLCDAWP